MIEKSISWFDAYKYRDAALQQIIRSLALVLRIDEEAISKELPPDKISLLVKALSLEESPFVKRNLRKYLSPILRILSAQKRLFFTNILKRLRNPRRTINLNKPSNGFYNQLVCDIRKKLNLAPAPWSGKKSAICITYDIDNSLAYQYINEMMKINERYGIVGTFNFITHYDYKIEKKLIQFLIAGGCEIGLHGYFHDIGLAYRKKNKIKERLSRAINEIPCEVKGFRSPALSVSRALFEVLTEIGIEYDSSLQVTIPFYKSVGASFPYLYPGLNIWEIPLTIQDDTFFRDVNLNQREALELLLSVIEDITNFGGVSVINLHPNIIKGKRWFYDNFLNYLKNNNEYLLCTMYELVKSMRERMPK
ncbi:MAG: polysaccharide deacetylase family protein [bacterium]